MQAGSRSVGFLIMGYESQIYYYLGLWIGDGVKRWFMKRRVENPQIALSILVVKNFDNIIIKLMNINSQITPTLSQQFHQSVTKQVVSSPSAVQKQPFISRVQRFDSQASFTPGPGAYNPLVTEKHTIDFKRKSSDDQTFNKQFAWIYDRSRMSFALSNSSQSKLGPGEYEETKGMKLHSSWAKGQRFDSIRKFQSLGPGYYENSQKEKQKQKPMPVFKSKAPKSFIQQLIARTNKQAKRNASNPEQVQEENQEIVKFQQTQYPVKQKVSKKNSPFFLSKDKRPDIIHQTPAPQLGPGTYDIENKTSHYMSKTKGIISAIHYNLSPIKTQTLSKLSQAPGPGAYEVQSTKLQKLTKKQPLGIIFHEQRFKMASFTNSDVPGPGQYNQKRFTMLNQQDVILKSKGSFIKKAQVTHNFGKAARSTLRKKNDIPFGSYDVKNFDIQFKLEKQRQHFQKLKLMEVTLPAFNSKKHD